MTQQPQQHKREYGLGTVKSNFLGFVLSIALTLVAYFLVTGNVFEGYFLNAVIVALGFVQVIIQLIFFLHLGDEPNPKWNLLVFLFMVTTVAIIVLGTLWIMYNLDYNTMMMDHK